MKKVLILSFFTLCISFLSSAQTFPTVSTISLEGNTIELPHANSTKLSVVGLAFSQKAQDDLNTWLNPIYNTFIDKSGFNAMVYDVNVELLIAFTGAAKTARKKAEKKLKEATDNDFKKNVLLWSGDYSTFSSPLRLKSKKTFYLFLIDSNGKILYQTEGRYTEKKMEELGEHAES